MSADFSVHGPFGWVYAGAAMWAAWWLAERISDIIFGREP